MVSIQIIYNIFRRWPASLLFEQALRHDVAIIARVRLASALLSGKFKADGSFEAADHRQFNRNGEAFDVGETFSGKPYEIGLAAVERIRPLVGHYTTMAHSNAEAAVLPALSQETMAELSVIYDQDIRPHVHHRW